MMPDVQPIHHPRPAHWPGAGPRAERRQLRPLPAAVQAANRATCEACPGDHFDRETETCRLVQRFCGCQNLTPAAKRARVRDLYRRSVIELGVCPERFFENRASGQSKPCFSEIGGADG